MQETGEVLVLQWGEEGGPEVKTPQREGYGATLICELLAFELDGAVDLRYSPKGVTCKIQLPINHALEKAG